MSNKEIEIPNFEFQVEEENYEKAVIKVIGVGGGGGNAVSHMLQKGMEGISFCAANTDVQALNNIQKVYSGLEGEYQNLPYMGIKLGIETTKGLGAGARPDIGQKAVQESIDDIKEYLEGADMVFITAGMGGGTGTGGASVVASLAKQMGVLTVAIVTRPFKFEGGPRSRNAEQGINALSEHVDSLIIIPNEKLIGAMGKNTSLTECFTEANNVLYNSVHGISDLITRPGLINVDFADVKTVMSSMGMTMMGTGEAEGEDRASEATKMAINSPLLEHIDIKGARGILVNIIADDSLSIGEFHEVGGQIDEYADPNANIVIGSSLDPNMGGKIMVTLVATGVDSGYNDVNNNLPNDTSYRDKTSSDILQKNQQNNLQKDSTTREQSNIDATEHLKRHTSVSPDVNTDVDYNQDFDDNGIGQARTIKQNVLSEEERRQAYQEMKENRKNRSLFGRKSPNISSDENDVRNDDDTIRRGSTPPRNEPSLGGYGSIYAERDLPKEESKNKEPESKLTGIHKFLSRNK